MSRNDAEVSAEETRLFKAVASDAAAAARQAIRDGANVNTIVRNHTTPLMIACEHGKAEIVGILLDAGADARWRRDFDGWSAIMQACLHGHLSTVQLLLNHDSGLLELGDNLWCTPLLYTVEREHSDIVQFLLDSGADAHHADRFGVTPLIAACRRGRRDNVRLLLAAGVDVDAHDRCQQTALHFAAHGGDIEVVRELILQHNANMFAVDRNGFTPFDWAGIKINAAVNALLEFYSPILEMYGNRLTHDHGRLALHELLKIAEYSFAEDKELFHPPLNPLRIILPLGKLKLTHLRTLLHTLDPELFRTRDDNGKLPIHIACQTKAPVEVLVLLLEFDPATLRIADSTGALPIHLLLCGSTAAAATEYASVRYLVEQGGVGTLATRNRQGLLPLHVLCGSTNPPLRAIQYLIQSFRGSVAAQTNAGHYPFMMAAAAESSSASLSVIYELVRVNPDLVVPR